MIVFSNTVTPRLLYILDFIGREFLGQPLRVTTDREFFTEYSGPRINYSNEKIADPEFRIPNVPLLFENSIIEQPIQCFEADGYKAFYKTAGDFPFDIFSACFYLLSRYEEYLPHKKDTYGRYAHENSLAFGENFLHLPLINIWLHAFRKSLSDKFPQLSARESSFTFIPTYDIDEAFSYKSKQWWRTTGGIIKSALNGKWSEIGERLKVLAGNKDDPYDSFDWMDKVHRQYHLHPYYFFLIAGKTGIYDKNILPGKKAMRNLLQRHAEGYEIGIHPSWQSGDDAGKLRLEILRLGHISGRQIVRSRQHFIRFSLPKTYRLLIDLGITADFSMGYGSINGFRASVASPYYWYDLKKEEQTKLLLYPFCFMDANSFFEQKQTAQQTLEELRHYLYIVRSVNGTLVTLWHNTFLGTSRLFAGWREMYGQFLKEVTEGQP